MNGIGDNNNVGDIWDLDSLINPTFDNKKFSLSQSDIDSVV